MRDLQQRAVGGVERRVAELFGVHFAEAFEAGDLQALFAGGADGGQAGRGGLRGRFRFRRGGACSAALRSPVRSCGIRASIVEAELGEVGEAGVDRADFVQLDDVEARGVGRDAVAAVGVAVGARGGRRALPPCACRRRR